MLGRKEYGDRAEREKEKRRKGPFGQNGRLCFACVDSENWTWMSGQIQNVPKDRPSVIGEGTMRGYVSVHLSDWYGVAVTTCQRPLPTYA